MDYFSFRKFLESDLGKLKLPADCKQREPEWEVIHPPLSWTVELFFDFPDPKHIRIWESYEKVAGLHLSRKLQWSYHYGETSSFDEQGDAARGRPDDPLDLRIDTVSGLHMHYQTREPHYKPSEVKGLNLASVDASKFIRAVLSHRKTGKPLHEIMGFKVGVYEQ